MTVHSMPTRPASILVDTNVWVDYFIAGRSGNADAVEFLETAWRESAQLLYPIGALQDIFAVLIMELKRETRMVREVDEACMAALRRIAWGCVDSIRDGACAVGADESDAWLACKYRKINWDLEDNMVLAAAERAGADYLVTSDRVLISKANVAAMRPGDMAALLQEMGDGVFA